MKYYIGIDLGGTNIVAGVVDENYNIVSKASTKTNCPRPEQEIAFTPLKCIGCGECQKACGKRNVSCGLLKKDCILCGKCVDACKTGARHFAAKVMTPEEVVSKTLEDQLFYDLSGGGVTFSGGECLTHPAFMEQTLRLCKEAGLHTIVDTCGFVPFETFEHVLPYVDLFLYDIKCFDTEKHIKYVGVGNELILENLQKLLARGAKVWIRIPVIPGVNDSAEEMQQIRAFLEECGGVERVELLPYHAMGENKYRAIGTEPAFFETPSEEKMKTLRAVFEEER